jgi:hypothetical protein
MLMIEKLKNTYSILNKLDELNSNKFSFNDISNLNNILETDINDYIKNQVSNDNLNNTSEINQLILDIVLKIDSLESKILPKASLLSSFSDSTI